MKRRDFLKAVTSSAIIGLSGCQDKNLPVNAVTSRKEDAQTMQLRPHHIIDIVTSFEPGREIKPHPYGHSQHIVAKKILENLDTEIQLVIANDAICRGCKYLKPDGQCSDVLAQLNPSPSKQAYNDVLDHRLLDYLKLKPNAVMTVREYLEIVNEKVPGIERICTHPKEDEKKRLERLERGLRRLNIRR